MKDTADIPRMTLDSADGRLDALTLVEGRAGSAVRETIRAWSPGASWASVEGSLLPPGPTRIEEERASTFTPYSRHAERVTLLLFGEADPAHPLVTVDLDPLKHKTWDLWHYRLGADDVRGACYYGYTADGPRGGGGIGLPWAVLRVSTPPRRRLIPDPVSSTGADSATRVSRSLTHRSGVPA